MPSPENIEIEDDLDAQRLASIFWKVSRLRTAGMGGPDPLLPQTYTSWMAITGTHLLREEVEVLMDMDMAFLAAWRREATKQREAEARARDEAQKNRQYR